MSPINSWFGNEPALVAIALFAVTNIDDLLVLVGLFSSGRLRAAQIAIGQFLGIALLVAASVAAARLAVAIEARYVALIGVVPIALGIRHLFGARRDVEAQTESKARSIAGVLGVAATTIANGGDNLGVYTPVFATMATRGLALTCAVFAAMVALWLLAARWLVAHPLTGAWLRRASPIGTPLVLIVLGAWIVWRGWMG
jgi:cadmium resistance protein CadD (predicted permease)